MGDSMNIILIGMPGCGKSTIGVLLAKAMLYDFVDTDLLIQNRYGESLCTIIDKHGIEKFKEIENGVLCEFKGEKTVVATGGSAVYGKEAMANLGAGGKTVYLKLSPEEIIRRIDNVTTRGIAMEKGTTLEQLYLERAPLYEKYADITIECSGLGIEECVAEIKSRVLNLVE